MNTKTQFLIGVLVVISAANIESAYGYPAVSAGATDGVIVGTVVGGYLTNYDNTARFMTFPVRYPNGRTGTEQFATRHYHQRLTDHMQALQSENESLRSGASTEALEQENRMLKGALASTLVGTGILAYWLARK